MKPNKIQQFLIAAGIILVLLGFIVAISITLYINIIDWKSDTFSLLFLIRMMKENIPYRLSIISIIVGCILFWLGTSDK